MTTDLYSLIAHPITNTYTPTAPPPLSQDKQAALDRLAAEFIHRNDLSAEERMWLTRECFLRFLAATKQDHTQALARVEKCLAFRRAWNLYDVPQAEEDSRAESFCGKEFLLGYGKGGLPVLYFYPNRSDTEVSERQMRHTVYMMERTIDMMPRGIGNLTLIIDLAGKRQAPTSVAQAKLFVEILGNHYPERLGTAVILNLPWMVKKFLDLIFKFVDPVTKAKISWSSGFVKEGLVPKSTALREHGGDFPFVYKQEQYWPVLLQAALDRRQLYRNNFQALGSVAGLSEWDIKGPSIAKHPSADLTTTPTNAGAGKAGSITSSRGTESTLYEHTGRGNHNGEIQFSPVQDGNYQTEQKIANLGQDIEMLNVNDVSRVA